MDVKRGDFVIYVSYGKKEFGVVTSVKEDIAMVRYMRTLANSEATNIDDLIKSESVGPWLNELDCNG